MLRKLNNSSSVSQNGPIALFVARLSDGIILETNRSFLRLTGFASNEVLGFTANALNLWADADAREEMFSALAKDGHLSNFRIALCCKSGRVIDVLCSTFSIEVESQDCILSVMQPVEAESLTSDSMEAELDSLDLVEESGKFGFWDFNALTGKATFSHGVALLFGLGKGIFSGSLRDFFSRVHPDDIADLESLSQLSINHGSTFNLQYRIVRPDATIRRVMSRGAAKLNDEGAIVGVTGITMDVTEQVAAEEEYRVRARVMENMAEGVVMADRATHTILFANRRFEQVLGYEPGVLKGRPVHILNAEGGVDPIEQAHIIFGELELHGFWRGEIKNRCFDGREIWSHWTVSGMTTLEHGAVWIGVQSNITEQKNAMDALERARAQLQRMSFNYQDALEAERASVAREIHERIGYPLNAVYAKLSILAKQLDENTEPLANLTNQLLGKFSEVQRARVNLSNRLRPEILDSMGLVEACRWHINSWSEETGVTTTSLLRDLKHPPAPNVATDMFRALQELLTNVSLHAGATKVHIVLSGGATEIKLRVEDNGHGFDTTQQTAGFGLLGVRERVLHHHGSFDLKSSALGSKITLTMRLNNTA